jgi:hypothetical protein
MLVCTVRGLYNAFSVRAVALHPDIVNLPFVFFWQRALALRDIALAEAPPHCTARNRHVIHFQRGRR